LRLKKNIRNINKQDSLSKSSEKKGDLLIQVNELMEKLETDYGPLMLGELQKRLKKTIEDFHNDVNSVLKDAFNNHKNKTYDLNQIDQGSIEDLKDNSDTPSFIAEYQKKKNKK